MENVVVLGLGRIGLPQALVISDVGYRVYGVDTSTNLIEQLGKGDPPFEEPELKQLLKKHLSKNFVPTHYSKMETVIPIADYIILTIGVELTNDRASVDLNNLYSLIEDIFKRPIKKKAVIISRTTAPLGTTDNIKQLIKNKYGLIESEDFYLAFVPERLAEGYAIEEERNLPKIVGTYSDTGFEEVKRFFAGFNSKVVRLSSPKAAELSKLVDNTFRDTLFAYANELALVAEVNGLDAIEVIKACNVDYPRNFIPFPGPVSGFCLGKDPYILELAFAEVARKRQFNSVWFYGRKANESLLKYIAQDLSNMLRVHQMNVNPRVLVLGLSFKQDIDDYRVSHAIDVIRELHKVIPTARFSAYDPYFNRNPYTILPEDLQQYIEESFVEFRPEIFINKNVIVIMTPHKQIAGNSVEKIKTMLGKAKKPLLVYDCWNVWTAAQELDDIIYKGLGR